jgi:ketosteroid isomerase-like protein
MLQHLDSVMSENVELVREGIAAWLSGDVERASELVHPDVVSIRMPPIPDPQTYHGVAGIQEMYDDWTADFGEFEMEPLEFVDAGERVVVGMIQRGTGKASGASVEGRFWFVFTIVDRRVTRQEVYNRREEALEAAS